MTVIVAALAGLIVGSFLNVVIYRLPRGESLVQPGSHCPSCGAALGSLENIPVFSWLALRGRCKSCGAPISIRYPLVELLTAALFALAILEFGVSVASIAIALLAAFLVAMTFIDLDHLLIPDGLAFAAGAVGVVFALLERSIVPALEGLAVFAGLLGAIYLATHGAGLGLGDVKMGAAIGLFLGFPAALAAAVASFVVGAAFAIPVLVARKRGRKEALPFGPFMVLATLVGAYAPVLLYEPGALYQQFLVRHFFAR